MVRKFPPFRSERIKRSTSEGTPQFPNGIPGKLPYHLTSNRNFRIFSPNGKHPVTLLAPWRNVISKVISNRTKGRKSKSTEQYDCKHFFHLDGTCDLMVESFNSTGIDFDLAIKFNASTGEEHCE